MSAVNAFDAYTPRAPHTLDLVRAADACLPTIEARLEAMTAELAGDAPRFNLRLDNAGMDPHQHCPIGGLPGITGAHRAARERLVFDWCREHGIPVAFGLAGGYTGPQLDREALVDLHRLTLSTAAD